MAFYHSPAQVNTMSETEFTKTNDPAKILPSIPQKISRVRYPDKKVLAAEWSDNHRTGQNGWWSWSGARNYLFTDGHVRFLNAKALLPANDNLPDPNLTRDGLAGRDIP
jgi:prepilin-type processing-associated H-X9-DG protein